MPFATCMDDVDSIVEYFVSRGRGDARNRTV